MTDVEEFARYLHQLHTRAGAPSRRGLAGLTGYGKTAISDAFAGRNLPTWPLVEKLVSALGGKVDEARERWASAKSGASPAPEAPAWLTSIRSEIPQLISGQSFAEACTLAVSDPKRAMASAWEVLRLSAMQMSHAFYGDVPGNWSSDIVATIRRAEEDLQLPAGAAAAADSVHHLHVPSMLPDRDLAATDVLQGVFLAYKVAWQAHDAVAALGT